MITTILIVLVAVVVLIVIIAVLALRYLRADDSDTFDDIPDEPRRTPRSPQPGRQQLAKGAARRPRPAEPVTEVRTGDRPARLTESRGQGGYRDRDSGPRPIAAERVGSQPGGRREPAAARAARAAGPDALSSSWDSLSDIDYWAELAADKPQITPAAAGPAVAGRRGSEPGPDTRQIVAARPDSRAEQGQPTRKRPVPARAAGAAPGRPPEPGQTEQIDVRPAAPVSARYGGEMAAPDQDGPGTDPLRRRNGSRSATPPRVTAATQAQRPAAARSATAPPPAQPSRPPTPAAQAGPPNGAGRAGRLADDDPLTSPSFPAVNTSDSRSYRGRRSAGASGQHARPGRQYIEYSSAPDRAASRPDGYPVEPPAAQHSAQASQQGRQALPPASATPAANPYGSYVSAPQPAYAESAYAEPTYQPGGYQPAGSQETPAASFATASHRDYAAGQPAAAGRTWYPAPAIEAGSGSAAAQPLGQQADGYLPAAGLLGTGNGGSSHAQNGSASRGYAGIDYSNLTYDDPVYPGGQSALAGYGRHGQPVAPYDQQGYGSQDAGYRPDGYQAYPGYGASGR